MEVITLCAAAVTTVIAACGIKKYSPEISLISAIAGGVLILLFVLPKISPVIEEIQRLSGLGGLDSEYISILLKTIGICLMGRFTSDLCCDNGYSSLGAKIEFASKVSVLIAVLPLYRNVLEIILHLLESGQVLSN